jgi:hypothetical protein
MADYVARDVVERNGSTYICILAHSSGANTEPGTGVDWETYWDLMVAGASGTSGTSGIDGTSGTSGSSGSSGIAVSDAAYGASWDNVTDTAPSKNAVYDKVETLMAKTGSNLAIGSDADGDMYYRASGVLARLAKGTAGQFLRMNATATGPIWAHSRIITTTDDATAVIDTDITDQYQLTAVANATEFSVTGTPSAGQKLIIRVKDAGVSKALNWNAVFRAIGCVLPTATTASKTTYVGAIYNATDSKWDVVAVSTEA